MNDVGLKKEKVDVKEVHHMVTLIVPSIIGLGLEVDKIFCDILD